MYILNKKEIENVAENATGNIVAIRSVIDRLKEGQACVQAVLKQNDINYAIIISHLTTNREQTQARKEYNNKRKNIKDFANELDDKLLFTEGLLEIISYMTNEGILNRQCAQIGSYKRNHSTAVVKIPSSYREDSLRFLIDSKEMFAKLLKALNVLADVANTKIN